MSPAEPASSDSAVARLRSGAAARLAGLAVATLRVWERRYGVVAAPKTLTGQRLYSATDVQRLRLLKSLTDRGHSIGTIAALPLASLQDLATDWVAAPRAAPVAASSPRRVVVVGAAAQPALHDVPDCRVAALHETLAAALERTDASAALAGVDCLLVHLTSLQPGAIEQSLRLANRLGAARLVVLYSFGAHTLVESLRSTGAVVWHEPGGSGELAALLSSPPSRVASWLSELPDSMRPVDDSRLSELIDRPPSLACECTRHVAELVRHLAQFERYSAECASISAADRDLHRHLAGLTGVARTLLEQGLQRLIERNGSDAGAVQA